MIRRLIAALRRSQGAPPLPYPPRPNALSRDVARAERQRREALQAEASARRSAATAEENQTPRDPPPPAPAHRRPGSLADSLQSRSELRRALLLHEILGPPAALRRPRNGNPGT